MLIVQRVMTRWSPAGRGAAAATQRRAVPTALLLPEVPDAELVVHDVHAFEVCDRLSMTVLTCPHLLRNGTAGPGR
jgi:hypothetical protein